MFFYFFAGQLAHAQTFDRGVILRRKGEKYFQRVFVIRSAGPSLIHDSMAAPLDFQRETEADHTITSSKVYLNYVEVVFHHIYDTIVERCGGNGNERK